MMLSFLQAQRLLQITAVDTGFHIYPCQCSCISMAECWHTFEHFAQPMHPTVQFFLTTAPLSMLEHATVYSLDFGTILIIFLGQDATHISHALHLDSTTLATPFTSTIASRDMPSRNYPCQRNRKNIPKVLQKELMPRHNPQFPNTHTFACTPHKFPST